MDTPRALAEDDDGSSSHVSSKSAPGPSSSTSVDIDPESQRHGGKPVAASASPCPPPTPSAKRPSVLRAQSERWPPGGGPYPGAAGGPGQLRLRALALAPRPFECLHAERSYLQLDLQRQGERAGRLVCRLAAAEDKDGLAAAPGGGRARRRADLLRAQVVEAAGQEWLVLLRLSELYIEVQSRERWFAAQQQRRAAPWMLSAVVPPAAAPTPMSAPRPTPTPTPPGGYHPESPAVSPLSPTSPSFVPRLRCFDGAVLPRQEPQAAERCGTREPPPPEGDGCPGREAEDRDVDERGHRPRLGARRLSLPDLGLLGLRRERRMSLASLGDYLDD